MSVKRSDSITAAAIFILFGSGFVLFFAAVLVASALTSETRSERAILLLVTIYAVPAAWGIANGVGIVRLQPWARISTIVMSFVGGVFLLMRIGMIASSMLADTATALVLEVPASLSLAALGIVIWWIVLFTRPSVKRQFARRVNGASIAPVEGGNP